MRVAAASLSFRRPCSSLLAEHRDAQAGERHGNSDAAAAVLIFVNASEVILERAKLPQPALRSAP